MAAVYKVRHQQLNSAHALKLLFVSSPAISKRLIREGRVQASLRHPNIVAVTDVLVVEEGPALVMEYVDGPPLDEWMVDRKLTVDEALHVFRGVVLAIAHAHSLGIAHRDLKPANILLARTNDGLVPKITDFGLMKALGADTGGQTMGGVPMGTPNYMSPEQIRDAASVDKRTDVFALGCILYELITGVEVFPGNSQYEIYQRILIGDYKPVTELVDEVPRHVVRAIEMCLMTERNERLSDCDMLFDMLYDQSVTFGATVTRGEAIQLESVDASRPDEPDDFEDTEITDVNDSPARPRNIDDDARRKLDITILTTVSALLLTAVVAGGTWLYLERAKAARAQAQVQTPAPIVPATPVPKPEPAPPKDLGPRPESWATVIVEGDAQTVWLARGILEFYLRPNAHVAPQTYAIHAVFDDEDPVVAGELVVEQDLDITLRCEQATRTCTPQL